MSNYDMTFDKKITADQSFDTIFGGEEDNHLLDLVMKEDADAFNIDERDPESIEDGIGAIGKGEGLGSDVGPDHDANKPSDDSSDQKILTTDKELKANDQLNVSDTTGEKPKDGNTVDTDDVHAAGTDELVGNDPIPCERHLEDELDKMKNNVDSFDEAMTKLLEEVGDDELPSEEPEVAPATTPAEPVPAPEVPVANPADASVPAPAEPVAPDAEVPAPVAPASDAGISDMDLLDTDPVDSPEEGCCKEEADESEASVEDLDATPVDEDANTDKMKDNLAKMKAMQASADAANKKAGDAIDSANKKFLNHEAALEDEVNDKVDFGGVEDKSGKIGTGEGLGNDIGPDHDTDNKPKDDTSDEKITPKDDIELKNDQLNTSDDAGASKVEDGGMVKDFDNAGEDGKESDESFKEASVEDLEDLPEDEEDDVIDTVEDNDAKSEFSAAELNADEDDEILDMLD